MDFKMACKFKHTKVQVPDKDYICPKCKSTEFFIIECENYDCEKLHNNDFIQCEDCGYEISGSRFASIYIKKQHLVKCSHCKGTGFVAEIKNENGR